MASPSSGGVSSREPYGGVSEQLQALYEANEGFDVIQTTVSVGPEEFAAGAERGDVAEVRIEVEGGDGLLAVPGDGEWTRPGGVVEGGRPLPVAAEELVRRQTGVDCTVEELHSVSLVCLQCEESGEQVWELVALFGAAVESGSGSEAPAAEAVWCEGLSGSSRAF